MDIGIDLLANPSKVKKKTYLLNKKDEEFDLEEFILDSIIEEFKIDTSIHPKLLLKRIIKTTLKISNENKNIDISHLENLSLEEKKKEIDKLPKVLTKRLKLDKKIIEKKEFIVDVKKIDTNLPTIKNS